MGRLIFGDDILPLLCHTHGRKGVRSEFGTRASACVRVPEMSGRGASPTQAPSFKCSKSSAEFLSFIKMTTPRDAVCPLYDNIRSKSEHI